MIYWIALLVMGKLTSVADSQAAPPPHATTPHPLYARCLLLNGEDNMDGTNLYVLSERFNTHQRNDYNISIYGSS